MMSVCAGAQRPEGAEKPRCVQTAEPRKARWEARGLQSRVGGVTNDTAESLSAGLVWPFRGKLYTFFGFLSLFYCEFSKNVV